MFDSERDISLEMISKTEFILRTENGFNGSKSLGSVDVKLTAYDGKADFVYKELV